jgi:hypothetical protein
MARSSTFPRTAYSAATTDGLMFSTVSLPACVERPRGMADDTAGARPPAPLLLLAVVPAFAAVEAAVE